MSDNNSEAATGTSAGTASSAIVRHRFRETFSVQQGNGTDSNHSNAEGGARQNTSTQTEGPTFTMGDEHSLIRLGSTTPTMSLTIFTTLVTVVLVHNQDKSFYHIHKSALEKESGYFAAALGDFWSPERENVVILQGVKPAVFEHFFQWLYRHFGTEKDEGIYEIHDYDLSTDMCLDLYFLADMIGATNFMPCIMDVLYARRDDPALFNVNVFHEITTNLADSSMLYDFIVHWWVIYGNENSAREITRYAGVGATEAILQACLAHKGATDFSSFTGDRGACHYHEHDDQEHCPTGQD
ncbi:hypothetical protein KVT40_000080 [Elsinoe batatas]|uniref:BTB domain-containing protein n=1 Tax=Elsinoe batatas TaxID=2601811 RepID=A0A8K0LBB0_9PEZI|nr:hypothetical protein KVT40_000080 [Elsinoe batatas]